MLIEKFRYLISLINIFLGRRRQDSLREGLVGRQRAVHRGDGGLLAATERGRREEGQEAEKGPQCSKTRPGLFKSCSL